MGKKSGSGSGMNNPDHVSESSETIFWVKILKFVDVDTGSGMEKIRIRDKYPGSATLETCKKKSCLCTCVETGTPAAAETHFTRLRDSTSKVWKWRKGPQGS
jgi:hypothetical protein